MDSLTISSRRRRPTSSICSGAPSAWRAVMTGEYSASVSSAPDPSVRSIQPAKAAGSTASSGSSGWPASVSCAATAAMPSRAAPCCETVTSAASRGMRLTHCASQSPRASMPAHSRRASRAVASPRRRVAAYRSADACSDTSRAVQEISSHAQQRVIGLGLQVLQLTGLALLGPSQLIPCALDRKELL